MALSVCATPIGNLDDITIRVLQELRGADVVACEDTRRTRGLLTRHGIRARLVSLHGHNEARRTAELVPRLLAGERVALVSDAGLPGVSDPGGRLIAAALDAGVDVTVLPGPSAVETALVASGLASGRFRFVGFLPRGRGALDELWSDVATCADAIVAFEAARRLPTSLERLAAALPERPVAVCRELTKRFEEVSRGTARELAERFAEPPRGEITLVVGAAQGGADARVAEAGAGAVAAVAELVACGVPRRRAAGIVARLTRTSANALYSASL